MKTEIKNLPENIKSALKSIDFHGSQLSVEVVADCVMSLKENCCFEGNRSFAIVIDMATGMNRVTYGSWGGSNFYTKTLVDDCDTKFAMPANCAVIKGEMGGRGCFATLYLRPDNVVPGLLLAVSIDDSMYRALCPHRLIGDYKKQALAGITAEQTARAIEAGFIVKKGRGYGLTVSGRNAVEKYEKETGKRFF